MVAMAATILRRSSSSISPLTLRLVSSRTICQPALFTAAVNRAQPTFVTAPLGSRYYSEGRKPHLDEGLLRVIDSEIKFSESSENQIPLAPSFFPFKIEDHHGQQTITLSRVYRGETIKVEVQLPNHGDDENDDADDDDERENLSAIPMVVSISKDGMPRLEFGCSAFKEEVSIDSLSVKEAEGSEDQLPYEGPEFADLDENLQKGFYKYLEIRGIHPTITDFLHEYMLAKDDLEYAAWLKKLKKFVEA